MKHPPLNPMKTPMTINRKPKNFLAMLDFLLSDESAMTVYAPVKEIEGVKWNDASIRMNDVYA